MKIGKIFLDGYIELSPKMFSRGNYGKNTVHVDAKRGTVVLGAGIVRAAKVNVVKGEFLNLRIGIHDTKDKIIIAFDEDGEFKARCYGTATLRINSINLVRCLIENGFKGGKKYKVTSPEEGVIVVTKEEA